MTIRNTNFFMNSFYFSHKKGIFAFQFKTNTRRFNILSCASRFLLIMYDSKPIKCT